MKSRSLLKLKKLLLILILGLISNQLLAQNNIGIFFQAVARDNYSNPAKSRKIYIQSSVIQSSATGTKVLIEEHQANTDATGMFSISIGNGTRVGGSATGFSSIDWSNGPFFLNLKVAITPMSGVNGWDYTKEWVDMGTTSFGAVPYALYAANAAGVNQKLNISDTTKMLSVYAKSISVQALEATVNTKLSLADSLTKYVTPTMLAANAFDSTSLSNRINLKANVTDVNTALDLKVDKVTGKALSTNDYTTAEKTKLAAITGTNTGDQDLSALATNAALALKANTTDVTTALVLKANTADVTSALNLKANATDVNTALDLKVDKVTGKALSTNDYTTAEKTKLAAITGTNTGDQDLSALATNAALALKANTTDVTTALVLKANTADVTSALNLKANVSSLSTVATSGSYNDLSNKPTIPSAYTLPTASASVLGGVKVGSNLSIDAFGVLSANVNAGSVSGTVTVANGGTGATSLTGLVKGNGTNALTAAVAGTDYQAPLTLTTTGTGAATFSGTTLTIPTYSLPIADGTNLGGVKVGSNLNVDANGVLTANINAGTLTGTTLAANVVNSSLTSVGMITSGTISLTTDIATTGNLKAGAVTYPNTHGTSGQVLSTTGTGTLSWASIPAPDLGNYVTTNTAQTITASKTFSETTTFSKDAIVNGITVGKGGGSDNTNTAIGHLALTANTTGIINTANGSGALTANTTGDGNTGTGSYALLRNVSGSNNTANGAGALFSNITGYGNTAIGGEALGLNTSGSNNTAIGSLADVGSGNLTNATAIGNGAIVAASNTIQLGADGTRIVSGVLIPAVTNVKTSGKITAGDVTYPNAHNSTNGQVLTINAAGQATWAAAAGGVPYTGATGAVNLGAYDLTVNGITVGKGFGNQATNTAVGSSALSSTTTGDENTAIGVNALLSNTTGDENTAIGSRSLYFNTEGYNNTAIGRRSLYRNTLGDWNTANGHNAMENNNTGNSNTASGKSSLYNNTEGSNNTANGYNAMFLNTTGSENTAIGRSALNSNTTGSNNTAIGSLADVGSGNLTNATAIGYNARVTTSNTIQLGADGTNGTTAVTDVKTSGTVNAAGYTATVVNGPFVSTASFGVAGLTTPGTLTAGTVTYPNAHNSTSGQVLTIDNAGLATWAAAAGGVPYTGATGAVNLGAYDLTVNGIKVGKGGGNKAYNTVIGIDALPENTIGNYNTANGAFALSSNTTGENNTAVGIAALEYNTTGFFNTAIGRDAGVAIGSGTISNTTAIGYGAQVSASNTIRLGNTAVTTIGGQVGWSAGSDRRIKKNIVNSTYGLATVLKLRPVEYNLTSNDLKQVGFIAQEVQKLVPEVVTGKEGDLSKGEILGITYSNLVPVLTKAIQEQQKQIEEQNSKIAAQQKQIEELIKLVKGQ